MNLRVVGLFLVIGVALFSWLMTFGAWQYQKVAEGVVPIETRRFERPTLIAVGTGGAYENPARGGPATAVAQGERIVLVDAGRRVAEGLRHATISVAQPTAVYLTNLLPENVEGLDDLLLTGWLEGRTEPLRLLGPPGTAALAAGLLAAHAQGIAARAEVGDARCRLTDGYARRSPRPFGCAAACRRDRDRSSCASGR